MRQGTMRRTLAVASATAMAGAALAVVGAGAASAASDSTTHTVTGNAVTSKFEITRTVDEKTPTYGDVVNMTTVVKRTSLGHLLYRVRDFTPACMEYVLGSATWQATNGAVGSEATKPGEFSKTDSYVQWAQGGGVTATPFTLTAKYTVKCDSGLRNTGGAWIKRAPAGNAELGNSSMGPAINVQRVTTSVFLNAPGSPQKGETVTLRADTPGVPDGAVITFTVDGQSVGTGTVAGGKATTPWTPDTAGSRDVLATFAQTPTHVGAISNLRSVVVSEVNSPSSIDVAVAGAPKVGQSTLITASVNASGAGGTVEFKANNVVIGSAPIGADGKASYTWIPSQAGPGTIDVVFSGRPGVNPSSQGVPVEVAAADADQQATTTALDPIPATPLGREIILNATVNTGVAGGTVTFYDGQTVIGNAPVGAGGVATMAWNPSESGDRTIRADFSGVTPYLASQGATSAIITPAVVDPVDPTDPDTPGDGSGSLGSLTGILGGDGGGSASGSTSSLSSLGG